MKENLNKGTVNNDCSSSEKNKHQMCTSCEGFKLDRTLKENLAKFVKRYVTCTTVAIWIILATNMIANAFWTKHLQKPLISDMVISILFGTFFAQVLGLMYIVLKNLFPQDK